MSRMGEQQLENDMTTKPAVIEHDTQVVTTPDSLIALAIEKGTDVDQLTKLFDLKERYDAAEAKKAYVAAMASFRANCPAIKKTRDAYDSKYAGLAETIGVISKSLEEHGLSHAWKTEQSEGRIAVTCCITHVQGHQECTRLEGPPDPSGSKNNIQAIGSTVSYLERYTLFAILGLASQDDDGKAADPVESITDEQALKIESMISDHELDSEAFHRWLNTAVKVEEITDIPVDQHKKVIRKINTTIKAKSDADT